MPYGLTLDRVKEINRPAPVAAAWGSVTSCTEMAEYALYRIDLHAGAAQPLHFHPGAGGEFFLESGEVLVRSLDKEGGVQAAMLRRGEVLPVMPFAVHGFASAAPAILYLFVARAQPGLEFIPVETAEAAAASFAALARTNARIGRATTDQREKYWGRIETIVDGDVAGKRMFVHKGGQSSLEFHVEKRETYFIHSGRLKVGLRIGRAENHSVTLGPGESYDIRPGLMHMRIALEDTVIIEVSTRDSDADSFLVEDGQTYRHVEAGDHGKTER